MSYTMKIKSAYSDRNRKSHSRLYNEENFKYLNNTPEAKITIKIANAQSNKMKKNSKSKESDSLSTIAYSKDRAIESDQFAEYCEDIFDHSRDSNLNTRAYLSPQKSLSKESQTTFEGSPMREIETSNFLQLNSEESIPLQNSDSCIETMIKVPNLIQAWIDLVYNSTFKLIKIGLIILICYLVYTEVMNEWSNNEIIVKKSSNDCKEFYEKNYCASQTIDSIIYRECFRYFVCGLKDKPSSKIILKTIFKLIVDIIQTCFNQLELITILKISLLSPVIYLLFVIFVGKRCCNKDIK